MLKVTSVGGLLGVRSICTTSDCVEGTHVRIFSNIIWKIAHLFVPLTCKVEGRLHLGNENKSRFILHFARFALPLTASKVLTLENTQINLVFYSLIRTFAADFERVRCYIIYNKVYERF